MARATYELDFFTVQRHFSPRGAFWHTAVHAMHSSGTYQLASLVFHSSLLTVKSINLVVARDGLLCVTELSVFFIVATLVIEVLFKQFLIRTAV